MPTIQKVIEIHDSLVNLIKNDKELGYSIPKSARLTFAKNLNLAIPVVEAFSKTHNALVAQYGEQDAKGQLNVTDPKKLDAFFLERSSALNSEADIANEFESVRFSDFPEGVSIDLIALMIRTGLLDVNA